MNIWISEGHAHLLLTTPTLNFGAVPLNLKVSLEGIMPPSSTGYLSLESLRMWSVSQAVSVPCQCSEMEQLLAMSV